VRTIRSLPLEIPYKKPLEVRGEIYIPKLTFDRINSDGKYSSARNLAAGSVKLLDCAEIARRGLDAVIYSAFLEEEFQKESEQLEFLRELGFKVVDYKLFDDLKELIEYCLELEQTRGDFPFDMDGAVVKVDDLEKRRELSFTSTHPRFATAFKFMAVRQSTTLREVRWQVSRNGILTPVGIFDSINIDGAKITNATLHNAEFAVNFRIGSTIEVIRAGEVIPKIIATLVEGDGEQVKPPAVCPDCGAPTEIRSPVVVCLGTNCLSQVMRQVIHYAEKDSLDIRGLGDVIIEDLVRAGKVKTPADLYYLRKEDLLELPGFADKKAENILAAINKSKNPPLDKFLHGLGIPYTGVNTSRNLAKTFKTISGVMEASYEQVITIEDIGEITANGIVDFFRNNRGFVEGLLDAGVVPQTEETLETGTALAGKSFVITGTLSQPRSYFENLIILSGGRVAGGVSSKTNFLLAGENTGASKSNKAKELGVKVITEAELIEMLG
jgi:DNA ligase (NAD+)